MNKEIKVDNDDNEKMLKGIENPMQRVFYEKQVNRNIQYDDRADTRSPSNKGKLDEIVDDIGK